VTDDASVDLLPSFSAQTLQACDAQLFVRTGGHGPPLLLLHGYPQTHVCWHRVAPLLAEQFTVVVCDLPGYGRSRISSVGADAGSYSKRTMAAACLSAMKQLGFDQFSLAGHDRGGRVAYRMALDHPSHVERLAVLSILPTFAMWQHLKGNDYALQAFRWFFLAQPAPLPEALIIPSAHSYLHATLAGWTTAKDLSPFSTDALSAYETAFSRPEVVTATCRDYRAGWTHDREADERDLAAGRKISCPTLVLWGHAEFADQAVMLESWKSLCTELCPRSRAFECGHFLPEEAPLETASGLLRFFLSERLPSSARGQRPGADPA
jgi:haloacetate dehalogenase